MTTPPCPTTTDDTLAEIDREAELVAILTLMTARFTVFDHCDVRLKERAVAAIDRAKWREQ